MTKLRVLHLKCTYVHSQILDSSLLYSLQSLMNIQTLSLMNLKLGDISILGNLPSLVTLELNHCSIIELSEEILGLKRLRLLEIRACKVKMNNPFEVIERCSQLEELYFVDNGNFINENIDFQNLSPLTLQRYQISSIELLEEFEKYGLISRYFFPHDLRPVISEETFKQLVGAAELLILGGYDETRWKNLVPDIVHMECGGMNDLIILHMYSWPDIQCLIDTRNHYFDVIAFSKLIELHLFEMDIEDLYRGSLPSGFLEQLETMELKSCLKLQNMLFNGKLNLCHLKAMELKGCVALTSIFQLSTARSLVLLEELTINDCHALEHIVFNDSSKDEIVGDDNGYDQKSHDSLFPKLKTLRIARCDNLEMILPVLFARGLPPLEVISICECEKLKYMFSQYREEDHVLHQNEQVVMLPLMKEMKLSRVPSFIDIYREHCKLMSSSMQGSSSSVPTDIANETLPNPNAHACSWAPICCFPHESKATSEETKASATISKEEKLADLTTPLVIENRIQTMTDLTVHYSNVEDIFNLAQSKFERNREGLEPVTSSLEYLTLGNLSELRNICEGPKYILSLNNLKKLNITSCKKLKTVFSISILRSLPELWKLEISDCEELVHIVGEDIEENASDRLSHEPCFPKLHELHVKSCNMLKYLFSISMSGILPNLMFLSIKEASKLKHVIISHVEMKEMVMTDVLPELYYLIFEELPSLVDVCHGIDFQAVRISSEVYNCPNFSFYENSTTHLQVGLGNLDSKVQVAKDENLSSHLNTHQFGMRKAEGSQDLETQQSSIGSPNLTRVVEVTPKEGPSSNTSHPCPLDSTKPMALVPMSPILIALPTEGSSFTIIEIFEEEEEEEGGLITICRCRRGIKEVSSLIPEDPQITCRGAPLPLINAPLLETSIQEGSDQDDVGTTNQLIREAVDTIQVSKNSNALAIVPSKDGNVETIGPLTTFFEHASDGITEEVSLVQNECEVILHALMTMRSLERVMLLVLMNY
ncbi:uncharacterized protein LOC129296666 isoform X2 [Prosopis cineraria]|uniref:uncharacterized protein LOC129296666 isoform X2 n=1 Tax=Prosopis cineraria TaxID=364024 RepID=UPI00240F5654|nr:uncharacterized protein LOC129296666 isoform X2 [Prosopis cineraria]